LDHGYEDGPFSRCVHFVIILNPFHFLSCAVYYWVELKASKLDEKKKDEKKGDWKKKQEKVSAVNSFTMTTAQPPTEHQ
jgi:hypothetical protein